MRPFLHGVVIASKSVVETLHNMSTTTSLIQVGGRSFEKDINERAFTGGYRDIGG